MSVTRQSKSIQFTATNDLVAEKLKLTSLQFKVTGGTVGQILTITDNDGSILVDYFVEATTAWVEFLPSGPKWVQGLKITSMPATGGGVVTAVLD